MEIPICLYYIVDVRHRRFYCSLAVSATFCVVLTKISNLCGIAVQWNGGLRLVQSLLPKDTLLRTYLTSLQLVTGTVWRR